MIPHGKVLSPLDYTLTLPDLPNLPNPLCPASGVHSIHNVIELHRYSELLLRKAVNNDIGFGELAEASGYLLVARASADLSWAMLFGEEKLAEHSIKSVEANILSDSSGLGGISAVRWLAKRWLVFSKALWNRSSQLSLRKAGFPLSYLRRLASDGIIELWPQQADAIDAGLFQANSFVVAIPTGSGKTLLAELSIIRALSEVSKGWACYLAPTRALVSQVERDLSSRLEAEGVEVRSIIAGPEDSEVLGQEISQLIIPNSLTITTPEKLESYYRFAPESFENLTLLIVDEAQIVGDSSRGPLQEQIIARFRQKNPNARILLLSAAVSNVDELANWLGPDAKSFYTSTRLNRQIFAVAVKLADLSSVIKEYTWRRESRRTISYQGGLVTDFDLEESIRQDKTTVPVAVAKAFEVE